MTPQERFKKEMKMAVTGYQKGFAFSEEYVLWLESLVIEAEQREQKAFEAAKELSPTKFAERKYKTFEDYKNRKT